jgi:hypothetical protein
MKLFLLLLTLLVLGWSNTVITWVPPYNDKPNLLNKNFGGVAFADAITHIALQFWRNNTEGSLQYVYSKTDASVTPYKEWGQANNIKVLLCLYNVTSDWDWSIVKPVLDSPSKRTTLINNLLTKTQALGLDGVQLDWEGKNTGASADKSNFLLFVKELSDSLRSNNLEFSIASFYYSSNQPNWNWWDDLAPYVDNIVSMGYDGTGEDASNCEEGVLNCTYQAQVCKPNDYTKISLGVLTSQSRWQGKSAVQQLTAIKRHGTGLALWDYANRNFTSNAIWSIIKEIKEQKSVYSMPAACIPPSSSSTNSSFATGYYIDYMAISGENSKGGLWYAKSDATTRQKFIPGIYADSAAAEAASAKILNSTGSMDLTLSDPRSDDIDQAYKYVERNQLHVTYKSLAPISPQNQKATASIIMEFKNRDCHTGEECNDLKEVGQEVDLSNIPNLKIAMKCEAPYKMWVDFTNKDHDDSTPPFGAYLTCEDNLVDYTIDLNRLVPKWQQANTPAFDKTRMFQMRITWDTDGSVKQNKVVISGVTVDLEIFGGNGVVTYVGENTTSLVATNPIPSSNLINLNNALIEVYSAQGQKISAYKNVSGALDWQSGLKAGVYFLKVEQNQTSTVSKVYIQK